jgi:hypothetical protein
VSKLRLQAVIVLAACLLAPAAAFAGPAARPTAAEARRATEIEQRLERLAREARDLSARMERVAASRAASTSAAVATSLDAEAQALEARRAAIASEVTALQQERAALPAGASRPQVSPTGPLGPLDPKGLTPLNLFDTQGQVSNPRAFNPAISVIPDVVYFRDNIKGESFEAIEEADGFHGVHAAGDHGHDHAHGSLAEGFNLRATELAFSASVDPYFDAFALFAVSEEGIEAEEVYFQTRGLPGGLQVRGGKFLSGIGYANRQHPHQWELRRPEPRLRAALRWARPQREGPAGHLVAEAARVPSAWRGDAPGREREVRQLHRAEEYPGIGGVGPPRELSHQAGPRLFTGFAKLAPDFGYSNALQLGVSYGHAGKHQEIHDHDGDGIPEGVLDGTGSFWGVDLVYKYDSPRPYGAGDLVLQGEYLPAARPRCRRQTTSTPIFKKDGAYVQAVYGIRPRGPARRALRPSRASRTSGSRPDVKTEYETSSRCSRSRSRSIRPSSRGSACSTTGERSSSAAKKETYDQFFLQVQLSPSAPTARTSSEEFPRT